LFCAEFLGEREVLMVCDRVKLANDVTYKRYVRAFDEGAGPSFGVYGV